MKNNSNPPLDPRKLYTIGEVAAHLGVNVKRIKAKPTHTINGLPRRYFSAQDVKAIRASMFAQKSFHEQRREAGFLSIRDVAAAVGFSVCAVTWWKMKGTIPEPTHRYGSAVGLYYNEAEFSKVVAFLENRKDAFCNWEAAKGKTMRQK